MPSGTMCCGEPSIEVVIGLVRSKQAVGSGKFDYFEKNRSGPIGLVSSPIRLIYMLIFLDIKLILFKF
jgi:hypothetical protein